MMTINSALSSDSELLRTDSALSSDSELGTRNFALLSPLSIKKAASDRGC
uniref:Uncharacterized protein n=1 Tax=Desertifilum tharense IPPAS B-1220 TaxID=1781255 RepID=A0ACD5GZY1_9CYAN